ncbi:MAG: orotate phosphoribosyltransferase-like protein [Euryarchaeota archaeon]|nr:orotate phosphoribosyltransferase-like protein [Euryarchaeota archaeon]
MRTLEELEKKAHELKEKGFTTGEIADELNVSRETAVWLLMHEKKRKEEVAPKDIFVDWSTIGSSPLRMRNLAIAMADLLHESLAEKKLPEPEVIVGIATSGIPLATIIADYVEASMAVIRPKKTIWEPELAEKVKGVITPNFAAVQGKKVVIVDDVITTGSTLGEAVTLLREVGADPLAVIVLIDKKGIDKVNGVPVKSLVKVVRI